MSFTEQDLAGRKYIFFDFDGTLADTKTAIVETATGALRSMGLSDEEIGDASRVIGPPFPEAFEQVYGFSREDAQEVTNRFRKVYFTLGPETFPLFDGIAELLQYLSSNGYHLAIASSKLRKLVDDMLTTHDVLQYFEVVEAQSLQGNHVTKGDLIRQALEDFGIDASQAIMVGDLHHDVNGATENNVPCVGVYFGNTAKPGELEAAGAAACAHSVEELKKLLTN